MNEFDFENSPSNSWKAAVFISCIHAAIIAFAVFYTSSIEKERPKKILVNTVTLHPRQEAIFQETHDAQITLTTPSIINEEPVAEPTSIIEKALEEPIAIEKEVALEVSSPQEPAPEEPTPTPEPEEEPEVLPPEPKPVSKKVEQKPTKKPLPKQLPKAKPVKKAIPKPKPKKPPAKKVEKKESPQPQKKTPPQPPKSNPESQKKREQAKKDQAIKEQHKKAAQKAAQEEVTRKEQERKLAQEAAQRKEQARKQALISDALSSLNQSDAAAHQKKALSGSSGSSSSKGPSKIASLASASCVAITSEPTDGSRLTGQERSYEGELVSRLKLSLRLPDYGEVKIKLTLSRQGKVTKVTVISAKSARNKEYVQKMLPSISFPRFGSSFEGKEEHTFQLSLSNDVSY
ncbi:MAG: tolA [Chlamydiia bacterium]|nr:tolA [Chlamydiia bacterium]